jgi:hypothetical protein
MVPFLIWTPDGTIPLYSNLLYNSTTLDETYFKSDFIYGPQTWKPFYIANYPLFEKQDMMNTTNTFNIMLIDLYAGMLKSTNYPGITLNNNGAIKIDYSFQNLPAGSLATFNMFGFAVASGNESTGVGWTNAVNVNNLSSTSTSGYYINEYTKIPTKIIVNTTAGYKGKIVNLIATLKDHANTPISSENVKFSVNGIFVGNTITDASGIATLPYTITQSCGIYTILAQFLENTIYTTSDNTNYLNIDPTPTNIIINPTIGFKGKIINLIAKLTDNNNQPLNGKIINFSIDETNIGNTVTNTLGIATLSYTITQNSGIYTILAQFLENTIYATSSSSNNLTIDNTVPSASVTQKGGYYNTTTIVILKMSEIGTIYYTLNGTNPTINSSKYITKLLITSNKTLKYFALDLAGNKSHIYSQIYIIDKIGPKVSLTSPINKAIRVSLTSPITINFSENIATGINYSKIYVKNLNTGKIVSMTKNLSLNTLIIKMSSRSHNTSYVVCLPSSSIKDKAGNNLNTTFNFKFRTL